MLSKVFHGEVLALDHKPSRNIDDEPCVSEIRPDRYKLIDVHLENKIVLRVPLYVGLRPLKLPICCNKIEQTHGILTGECG